MYHRMARHEKATQGGVAFRWVLPRTAAVTLEIDGPSTGSADRLGEKLNEAAHRGPPDSNRRNHSDIFIIACLYNFVNTSLYPLGTMVSRRAMIENNEYRLPTF